MESRTELVARPRIASRQEWQQLRDELLVAEKEATRALDALAARRRRLPMVPFDNGYVFDTPSGKRTLLELFDGRNQLVVYHLMDKGPDDYCPGCTNFVNQHSRCRGAAAGQQRRDLDDRVQHASDPDRGIQGADGVDDPVRVVARDVVRRRLRGRGGLPAERLPARSRGRVLDVLHDNAG